MSTKKVTVIDVRNQDDFNANHMNGALNIPFNELPQRMREISGENDAVFICSSSGESSSKAEQLLRGNGFSNVYDGGSWQDLNQLMNN
ncbi:MAG: rhodanese-like domain-containing protein [Bacteroidetes bacterium]|nr:rhodanese-like domain-containing protein [Bacteroidota bacterium]